MMKHINMKQLGCLLLATALLVGCTKEQYVLNTCHTHLTVDEKNYSLAVYTEVDWRGNVHASLIILRGYGAPGSSRTETARRRGVTDATWILNGKEVVSKTDTLYFIQGGEIVEKNYRDLGIDAQKINAHHNAILGYLRPILEKMIRENLPPQEAEMEEEL